MNSVWLVLVLVSWQLGCYRAAQYSQTGSQTGNAAGTNAFTGSSPSFNGAPQQGAAGAGVPGSFVSGSGQAGAFRPGGQSQQQQQQQRRQQQGVPAFPTLSGATRPGVGGDQFPVPDQFGGFPGARGPFSTSVVQAQATPTLTFTVTNNVFITLTDLVLNSVGVTQTQFVAQTTTVPTQQVVTTPVDDIVVLATTVVQRPEYVTVTETKSDFRLAIRTSVTHVTITHTSYAITNVPFTITATEVVTITSPVVRTVVNTQVSTVTDYRTVANTVFVHGYN